MTATRAVSLGVLACILACLVGGCSSTPVSKATPEATAVATAIASAAATSTVEATGTPAPQPSLEELYRPRAFVESETGREVTPSRIPPPSIEAANAEAVLWQRGYEAPASAPASFEGAAGSAERRCVEVNSYEPVRSGGFLLDATLWGNGRPMLGLEAVDAASVGYAYAAVLTVRLVSLDATRTTRVIEVRGRAADDEARWELPFGIEPHNAAWLMVATAGRNWGCFIVRVEVPGAAPASTIVEIEAEFYPSAPIPPERLATFGASISGGPFDVPDERRCVEVERDPEFPIDGERTVSGEWLLASDDYEGRWRPDWRTGERTIFVPLHQPEVGQGPNEPLALEAVLLDDPRHTYSYTEVGGVYAPVRGGGSEAGYVTGFMLPRAGRWALVARNGPQADWGCFVLEVGW